MMWCTPFQVYVCDIEFFGCAICFHFSIARKRAMPSPQVMHFIPVCLSSYLFVQKCFLLVQFHKLIDLLFYFDFFLNFKILLHLTIPNPGFPTQK